VQRKANNFALQGFQRTRPAIRPCAVPPGRGPLRAGGRLPQSAVSGSFQAKIDGAPQSGKRLCPRPQAIQEALDQFQGSAHRLEYVDTVGDIDFFNDSKATNVDAVARAVQCFTQPVVLIMGGQDKGGDFRQLREVVSRKTKNLIVMGRAADLIRTALEDTIPTAAAASMADAVAKAYGAGSPGDVVLLSPGCASFDMYANYGRRGDDFKRSVANLKRKISA
jgi:UDP-N-acetylmuramoylalanine-D-glutamate ligase